MLNPALAAAILGVSVWRKLMNSLIWQSVMWRPCTSRTNWPAKVRFALDSPLEGDGFELSVPGERGYGF